jgi:hypothetical protein
MAPKELTFNSPVMVKIPAYDVYIHELKCNGPVMCFTHVKVRHVVNMLDRGLEVVFKDKEAELKVLALVKQYTLLASAENERVGKDVYKLPVAAQQTIVRDLNIKEDLRAKREEVNPWRGKGCNITQIAPPPKLPVRLKKKDQPRIPKLYEFLPVQPDPGIIPSEEFDDLSL